ncbi:MAG TPA: hypothetical protein VHA11_12265, partial [Bryobacteraceae bacterium]|nr:hypothetical protein [Bryobacteraceae bacterium]
MRIVCGCCEPPVEPTPIAVENRPALSAIVYRVGTYASFREAMLLALAKAPELAALTTRSDDDYAITLLDLWAAVADVLTFYQERYANEAFLRTAQFRESILRLAGLIGYRLRPGTAARTSVAFTLDQGARLTIAAGQKVQSVPQADAQPQTFETLEAVAADWRFNRLRIFPLPAPQNQLQAGRTEALLDRFRGPAIVSDLAPASGVVLFNDGGTDQAEEKKVAAVRVEDDREIVTWSAPIAGSTWNVFSRAFKFRRTFHLYGQNAPEQITSPFTPDPAIPSRIVWRLASLASVGLLPGNTLQLDARYENLAVGSRLLIADTGAAGRKTLVTVLSISETNASLTYSAGGTFIDVPSTEAVTQVIVQPQVPEIANRRNVVVYELQGDGLSF